MRSVLPLLLILASFNIVRAQRNLSNSTRTSEYTYIYKVTPRETKMLFKKGMYAFDEDRYLHTLIDSFKTNTKRPVMPPGNYLLVSTEEANLAMDQFTSGDITCKLLQNQYDLQLLVHNRNGQPISNADVRVRNKKIRWDPKTGVYRSKHVRKGILQVTVNGVLYCYTLSNGLIRPFPLFNIKKALQRRSSSRQYRNYRQGYFYSPTNYESGYKGFMVFSKPMYKPNDTVKFKAWIQPDKGKPVNRPLIVRLTDRNFITDTIIATVSPYRPGAYEYSFVLNDSLDLDLDEDYLVTLEEGSGRKYDLDEYDGDDEDKFALQRQVLIRNKFRHEEYELGSVSFTIRTDRDKHSRNTPVALFLKAMNENDMAVMDGRVQIVVTPKQSNIHFHQPKVFLKDTLWIHEQPLDAIGETKIILPDSIFPAASFNYNIDAVFLNSNNERYEENTGMEYVYQERLADLQQEGDSLHIDVIEKGKKVTYSATLLAANGEADTVLHKRVTAPASIRIDPFTSNYYVVVDGDTTEFTPDLSKMTVACNSLRTRDSLFIQIQNPATLPAWYSIFEGNKLFRQGVADSLFLAIRTRNTKPWFVSIQYLVGDKAQTAEYHIPYNGNKLTVNLRQPEFVYPGQRADLEVDVKDVSGNPVADADITLFGYTRKFRKDQEPQLPFFGKNYRRRKLHNRFAVSQPYPPHTKDWLNWDKWGQRLGLDSIEYYKFLYPDSVYLNYEPAVDSITQVAPFVVSNGRPMAIQMLYIDDQPYFFRGAEQWKQYSFELKPGLHTFRLRTIDRMVHAERIMVKEGVKTIVSINQGNPSACTWFEKMPDSMTKNEQQYWDRYLILVERNNSNRMAYIQADQYLMLNHDQNNAYNYKTQKLIGPIHGPLPSFVLKGKYSQTFEMEGGYQYRFEPGLVKMKQWPYFAKPYNTRLHPYFEQPALFGQAITRKTVDSLWADFLDNRSATADLFMYGQISGPDCGKLTIEADTTAEGEQVFVKNILLFRNDDPEFVRIYKGVTRDLGYLREGNYRMLLLLKNDAWFLRDDILVRPGGINFYDLGPVIAQNSASLSRAIAHMINNKDAAYRETDNDFEADTIKAAFNQQYFKLPDNARTITGQVTSEGKPVVGVSVLLRNTNYGTVTNSNGYYSIKVPEKGFLLFASVGYESQEISIEGKQFIEIKLRESTASLNEVVVVGYGARMKKMTTGSVSIISNSSLQGRVAGVLIRESSSPLLIVDGYPVDKQLSELNALDIQSTQVLKADIATGIYGSRAANGVIIITTKKAAAVKNSLDEKPIEAMPGNSLRTHFRDEAYWFPSLRTNANGKANAIVVFPDDITNWKTFAIAATENKQIGMASTSVRSFKAISASLHLPNFAVAGDEMQVLGKAMNYGFDSMQLKQSFLVNGKEISSAIIGVKNSYIDTFPVTVSGDSMKLAYTIQRNDGYFDGEERKLIIFPQGVTETNGMFAALNKDSVISWQPSPGSEVTFHAEASVLPVLMDEIEHVYKYEYSCNEQLASKLKALLMKRKLYATLKKDFEQDKQIREIISRLNKSKANDNLWGWWKDGASQSWVTLHVIDALLLAEEQRFETELNKTLMKDYLVYSLDRAPVKIAVQLPVLRILRKLDSKILFRPLLDSLANKDTAHSFYETLSLISFEQDLEAKPVPDSLLAKQRRTVFGNIYWGEEGYHFFDNSIQNTLLMYRILKTAGGNEGLLQRIRQYFLEKRRSGHWRNTYESILILETILPDLMNEPSFNKSSSLLIRQGDQVQTVSDYPFTMKLNNREPIWVEKKGGQPVYLTIYQNKWNPAPKKMDSTFAVSSYFVSGRDTLSMLKAGEPVVLHVNVKVSADAGYVMVEIPIPAGCSYESKPQSWINNEVHREYFLNKVSIFCSGLKKGNYNFTVSLLPRYTGKYNLNPAKASMMYFPVFFGREGIKTVIIR